MSNKIYSSKEEISKENEKIRNEFLKESNELTKKIKKQHKKEFLIKFTCILIILILFKIFIGEISILSPLPYSKNRWYIAKLNNEPLNIGVIETKRTTIIPFLITFESTINTFFLNDATYTSDLIIKKGEKLKLEINAYTCWSENPKIQIPCEDFTKDSIKKNTNDIVYYNLFIRRDNQQETIMYNDVFIENISDYFLEKGRYYIEIRAKYKNVKSKIYIYAKVIDNENNVN